MTFEVKPWDDETDMLNGMVSSGVLPSSCPLATGSRSCKSPSLSVRYTHLISNLIMHLISTDDSQRTNWCLRTSSRRKCKSLRIMFRARTLLPCRVLSCSRTSVVNSLFAAQNCNSSFEYACLSSVCELFSCLQTDSGWLCNEHMLSTAGSLAGTLCVL